MQAKRNDQAGTGSGPHPSVIEGRDGCGIQPPSYQQRVPPKKDRKGINRRSEPRNLMALRSGRLVVVRYLGQDGRKGESMWMCVCDCGGSKAVRAGKFQDGTTVSCGCLSREIKKRQRIPDSRKRSHWPEYVSLAGAISRCTRAKPGTSHWDNYQGRGITVCERWQRSFDLFLLDMGPRPKGTSLDRIDVNGHYEPGNCRWATPRTQCWNRRTTIWIEGLPLAKWAQTIGVSPITAYQRWMRWHGIERSGRRA
jgi:hypothetical protein